MDEYNHMLTHKGFAKWKKEPKPPQKRWTKEEVESEVDLFYKTYAIYPSAKHFEKKLLPMTYLTAKKYLGQTPRQYLINKFG